MRREMYLSIGTKLTTQDYKEALGNKSQAIINHINKTFGLLGKVTRIIIY